jgi:large subunit ribosomal protein L4
MKQEKYSIEGSKSGEVELNDKVFAVEINDTLIYELVKSAHANLRQGTHSTKGRVEVRGGGAKPWRQKGTGRARAGTSRSPIWRGGGIVFGPKPRDYSISLPKNVKKAAYRSLLSLKMKDGLIKVVEDFTVEGKTKEMAKIGQNLAVTKGVLITDSEDKQLKRSISNLNWFTYNNVNRISGLDLFNSRELVITESAIKLLNEKFA